MSTHTLGFVFCTFDVGLHWNNYDAIADEGKEGRNNISTHGLLLALGSVFLRGEGIHFGCLLWHKKFPLHKKTALLAFRFFRHEPKQVVLCVHFLFYLLSILLPVHGIYSILYNHKSFHGDFHLINAHSWMGIALILANMIHVSPQMIIWNCMSFPQLITGLTAWFSTDKMRGVIMPKQRVFTIGLFLSSVAQLIGAVAQFDELAYSKLVHIFCICSA